ncbi:MAG: dihydroneopterin aldolase [Flavobacteriales bacterium]|jgi:dihydroneopterin aldolase|tara:strand:- start:5548 stop:5937 length:390 start_codon:yes stop_codon:yes gene_type:complete
MRSNEDFSDSSLQQVDVVDQREYAYHGCMDEEAIIGSDYLINCSVWADLLPSAQSDALADTVDYVAIRVIITEEMAIRSALLETVVQRICQRIFTDLPQAQRCSVKCCKLNPPIDGDVAAVCVRFTSMR